MHKANHVRVHVSGQEHSHIHQVEEGIAVEAIILSLIESGPLKGAVAEEILFFREDGEDEIPRSYKFSQDDWGKRFHAHACREIEVTVIFPGKELPHRCRPGTTIRKFLNWAKANFPIDKSTQYELRLSATGNPLDPGSHVGSYVKHHECKLTVYLTPDTRING
jgi:hypothetical protein